jgi:hypothetical protein
MGALRQEGVHPAATEGNLPSLFRPDIVQSIWSRLFIDDITVLFHQSRSLMSDDKLWG